LDIVRIGLAKATRKDRDIAVGDARSIQILKVIDWDCLEILIIKQAKASVVQIHRVDSGTVGGIWNGFSEMSGSNGDELTIQQQNQRNGPSNGCE